MANTVYHFHFLNELLPESDEEKAVFARENTASQDFLLTLATSATSSPSTII